MSTWLAELRTVARKAGWAVGVGSFDRLRAEATGLGWQEVATRKGDPTVAELRPVVSEKAHPRSLSATHGLGAQRLHVDGAHLHTPPDLIVLFAGEPNRTPTLLWSASSKLTNPAHPLISHPDYLDDGVFLVDGGGDRFLATAYDPALGWRYDPGCMIACDQRARQAARFFEEAIEDAHRHEWSEAGQVLVIDNRNALHAEYVGNDTLARGCPNRC